MIHKLYCPHGIPLMSPKLCSDCLNFSALPKQKDDSSYENILAQRIKKLEDHIEKLHGMINMEDRITASDVLMRLTLLEIFMKERIIDKIPDNYNRKDNEIEQKLDECLNIHDERIANLERYINSLEAYPAPKLEFRRITKEPHKCPVCDGSGAPISHHDAALLKAEGLNPPEGCVSCSGYGIVWG